MIQYVVTCSSIPTRVRNLGGVISLLLPALVPAYLQGFETTSSPEYSTTHQTFQHTYKGSKPEEDVKDIITKAVFQHTYKGSKHQIQDESKRVFQRSSIPTRVRNRLGMSMIPAVSSAFQHTYKGSKRRISISSSCCLVCSSIPTRVRNMWARMLTKGTEAGSSIPTRVRNTR